MPATFPEFCKAFYVESKDLLLMQADPAFQKALINERAAWFVHVPDIRNAVLVNALNPQREDQAEWMKKYEAMLGVSFLWPDPEE